MLVSNQMESQAFSYGSFTWWFGVVEDRLDPKKLGRLRVRMIGYHVKDKGKISTENLFWAMPIMPANSSSMNGIGQSPTGIVEGTHVMGFFMDGHQAQIPIIMGTIGGIPEEAPNGGVGFFDPNAKYPKEDFLNEPDTNRLSRNEKISETVIQTRRDIVDKQVEKALNSGQWDEPTTPYGATYPYNHVKESENGHVEEFDDTAGKLRYHRWHPSQTYIEDFPNGDQVRRISKDKYEIVLGDNNVHIKGDCNITVEGNATVLVKGNGKVDVRGNFDMNVGQNMQLKVGGSLKIRSGGGMYLDAPRIDLNKPGPSISF